MKQPPYSNFYKTHKKRPDQVQQFEEVASARSLGHPGSLVPSLDGGKPGSALPVRGSAYSESPALIYSIARTGLVFPLSVAETATPGLLLFPRTFARLALAVFVCGYKELGFPLPMQSMSRPEVATLVVGLACVGSIFSLLVVEATRPGPSLLLRSVSRPGSLLSALGSAQSDFSSSSRSSARLGSTALIFGAARSGSLASAPGCGSLGSLMLLRSPARLAALASVSSFSHPDLPVPPRQPSRSGSSVSASGMSCAGSVSSLSVVECAQPGFSMFLRSPS